MHADLVNSMIEFEFRAGRADAAWDLFRQMPTHVPNVETFKLMFKNVQPTCGFSNKVKASGIEVAQRFTVNPDLQRAI